MRPLWLGLILLALPLHADDPWQRAIGPWAWAFPRDHGAHPAFKTEWWYFTGNLRSDAGRAFGYQLTIFRQGVQFKPAQTQSRWALRDFYFVHFTVSDLAREKFHAHERVTRGALGEAHAALGQMDVALGPWTIQQAPTHDIRLHAAERDIALDLTAHPAKPLVLEGIAGFSCKGEGTGCASYYYSYPRLDTTGTLTLDGRPQHVTGTSWFDHEFSSSALAPNEVGWDWFCLQLDSREEIMLYALRDKSGAIDPASEGTWVNADGTSVRLPPGSFTITPTGHWRSPGTHALYPAGWKISIPARRAELEVTPSLADQELRLNRMGPLAYWEGACTSRGQVNGRNVTGVGYTELTGYAGPLNMDPK